MARIKQTKMRLELDPNKLWTETVVYINYDNTDKHSSGYREVPKERFYVKLPQVVADALGVTEVRGSDQYQAEERFKEAIEKFKKLKTEVNRLILYKFEVEPKPAADKRQYFTGLYKVSVWAGTYEETVAIAGDGTRRYSYERIESDLNFAPAGYADYVGPSRRGGGKLFDCQVPWTEQNEAFFLWVKGHMAELIARMYELEKPDKLVEAVSAGRLLPLASTPDDYSVS